MMTAYFKNKRSPVLTSLGYSGDFAFNAKNNTIFFVSESKIYFFNSRKNMFIRINYQYKNLLVCFDDPTAGSDTDDSGPSWE